MIVLPLNLFDKRGLLLVYRCKCLAGSCGVGLGWLGEVPMGKQLVEER